MGQTSLLDAFNAAAGFASTTMSLQDAVNREKAKAELQTAELSMTKEFDKYLLNLSQRNDFDNFETDWANQKVKIFNSASEGLSSPYAKDIASQMFASMDANQLMKIKTESLKRSADYTYTTVQNNNNEIMNSLAYTPEEKLARTQGNWKGLYDAGIMDYSSYNSKLMENGATIALGALQGGARKVLDEQGIEAAISFIQTNQDRLTLANGAEVPMDAIRGQAESNIMQEWKTAEAFRKMRQEEIWSGNENTASQIYLEMLSGGGVQSAHKGLAFLKNVGRDGLDSARRDEYALKYQGFLDKAAEDPKGATSKARLELSVDQAVAGWQQGLWTGEEGKNVVLDILKKSMSEQFAQIDRDIASGKKIDTSEVDKYRGKSVLEVYPTALNDFFAAIQKSAPEPVQNYVKNIKGTTESIYRTARGVAAGKKLSNEQETELTAIQADLAGYCLDIINESKFGDLNANEMAKKVNDRINLAVAKQYDVFQTGLKDSFFNPIEKQAAKMQGMIDKGADPVFVDTYGRENWIGNTKEGINSLRNYQRNEVARRLGIAPEDIGRLSITSEPTLDGHDATGSAIFSDTQSGKQFTFKTDEKSGKMLGYEREAGSKNWTAFAGSKDQKKADYWADIDQKKIEAETDYKRAIPGYTQEQWDKIPDADKFEKWETYKRQQYENRNRNQSAIATRGL